MARKKYFPQQHTPAAVAFIRTLPTNRLTAWQIADLIHTVFQHRPSNSVIKRWLRQAGATPRTKGARPQPPSLSDFRDKVAGGV